MRWFWYARQPAWLRGLIAAVFFGFMYAGITVVSSRGAVLAPALIAAALWGSLWTGYLIYRERREAQQ